MARESSFVAWCVSLHAQFTSTKGMRLCGLKAEVRWPFVNYEGCISFAVRYLFGSLAEIWYRSGAVKFLRVFAQWHRHFLQSCIKKTMSFQFSHWRGCDASIVPKTLNGVEQGSVWCYSAFIRLLFFVYCALMKSSVLNWKMSKLWTKRKGRLDWVFLSEKHISMEVSFCHFDIYEGRNQTISSVL